MHLCMCGCVCAGMCGGCGCVCGVCAVVCLCRYFFLNMNLALCITIAGEGVCRGGGGGRECL